MDNTTLPAWRHLLETGTLVVPFRVLDMHTEAALDGENVAVRADLVFAGDGADSEPAAIAEWGALGFLRCPACGHRGEVHHEDDTHEGDAAVYSDCGALVTLEWDGGVQLAFSAPGYVQDES